VGRNTVAEVIDAHLETVSMIFLTTCWAIGYGWVEGTIDIGAVLAKAHITWLGRFSTYHFILGLTVFAISFSFGFLKFTRMLFYRKRYMLFTALGNYPYALVAQDFSYFLFAPITDRLDAKAWTCQGLGLGCFELKLPWAYNIPISIPWWYLIALAVSAGFFFLAYRSALVNLLVTREVMKEIGYVEKVTTKSSALAAEPFSPIALTSPGVVGDGRPTPTLREQQAASKVEETKSEQQVAKIVDSERDELIRKLRERLERQGA